MSSAFQLNKFTLTSLVLWMGKCLSCYELLNVARLSKFFPPKISRDQKPQQWVMKWQHVKASHYRCKKQSKTQRRTIADTPGLEKQSYH